MVLNAAEVKFDTGDLFTNGENHRGKTPLSDFKVITPEIPQVKRSQYLIPTNS